MSEVMHGAGGVGLAAVQLGVPIRLFVACFSGPDGPEEVVFVNPRLIEQDGAQQEEEGCLSLPGVRSNIRRFARVVLEATDRTGKCFRRQLDGLQARIVQHEMDNLNGVLIVGRMTAVGKLANRRTLKMLQEEFQPRAT